MVSNPNTSNGQQPYYKQWSAMLLQAMVSNPTTSNGQQSQAISMQSFCNFSSNIFFQVCVRGKREFRWRSCNHFHNTRLWIFMSLVDNVVQFMQGIYLDFTNSFRIWRVHEMAFRSFGLLKKPKYLTSTKQITKNSDRTSPFILV